MQSVTKQAVQGSAGSDTRRASSREGGLSAPGVVQAESGWPFGGNATTGLGFHREVAVAALKKPFPSTRRTPSHSLLALQPRQTALQRHALFVTGSFC